MTERNIGDEDSGTDPFSGDVSEGVTGDEILYDADATLDQEPPHQPPPHQPPPQEESPPFGSIPPQSAWAGSGSEATGVRRLWRSSADRRIGGVAGGVANYLGVDPTIVRIIFLVLAFSGVAIVVYLAAWIIVPKHPADAREVVWNRTGVGQQQVAVIAGVAALCLAIVIVTESWTLFALSLVAGGVWLLSQQQDTAPTASFATPAPQAESAFAGAGFREATQPATGSPNLPPPPSWGATGEPLPWEEPAHREPRPPQRITRVVLSVLALLAALSIAAATGDWWDVDATRMLGIGVVVIGIGVVASSVTTLGGRWLVPLGIVGLVLLLPVNVIDDVVDDGIGDPTYRPTTLADLETEYRHGAGVLTVDLREVDLEGQSRSLDVELGVGEVLVIVPSDMGGTVELHAGVGEVESAQRGRVRISDGVDVDLGRMTLPGSDGTLDLSIDVGLGVARVEVD